MSVDRVGLAALAGGEHADPGGQFRGDVDHGFTVGDEALSDVPADAVAAFDRPDLVDARVCQDGVKQGGELSVTVADQEPRPAARKKIGLA